MEEVAERVINWDGMYAITRDVLQQPAPSAKLPCPPP